MHFNFTYVVVDDPNDKKNFLLQFIREYTGKVDELIKDKIEAQNEVKAKEQEEKEAIAQQVALCSCILLIFLAQHRASRLCFERMAPFSFVFLIN